MEEEKKPEKQLLPGINKELLDKLAEILKNYPLKDVVYTLWYILMTLNISIVTGITEAGKKNISKT